MAVSEEGSSHAALDRDSQGETVIAIRAPQGALSDSVSDPENFLYT
jgi:hypothetical protein